MAAKILVVEDNQLNRTMLERRLTRMGYQVVTAVDGEEGIRKAKSEKPALVLMDLGLPIIDGWEATRRIKADPETKDVPIVALTAHAMQAELDRAIASGCSDTDTKPVDFGRLGAKIEALLKK